MLGDIRYALRTFAKRPSFAIAAIATLALGIAVNTIAFSLLNSLALRPMPVRDAARVVRLRPVDANGRPGNLFSYPDYLDYRHGQRLFETLAAYLPVDLTAGRSNLDRSTTEPRAVLGYLASASYFDLTGVTPSLGRVLQDQDERPGARSAVLGHAFWQSRFNSSAAVVGSTLALNGESFTIVGVASPGFAGTEPLVADVWIPLPAHAVAVPEAPPLLNRDAPALLVVGRLAPGSSRARAADALRVIARRLATMYPAAGVDGAIGQSRPLDVQVAPGTFFTLDPGLRPVIAGVMAIVGLVLLVAAANVANLILALAVSRQREIAVRLAIGAARLRIIRQLTVEALLLSGAAGLVAILVAEWSLRVLYSVGISLAPFAWTIALNLEPDIRVFGYTLAIATLGGLVLGLVPAVQASSPEIVRALHGETTIAGARVRGSRLRHALVIVEVAASLVLLMAAGLLLRGLQSARALDLGFTAAGVVYADYDLRAFGYTKARAQAFNGALGDRAASMPGVAAVGFTSHVPLHGGVRRTSVRLLDARGSAALTTIVTTVTPGYFDALRIPIVAGRNFGPDDLQSRVIVSDGLARRFWPGEPAVGKALQATDWPVPRTVVGVVRDASNAAIWRDKEMAIYLPAGGTNDPRDLRLIVRTTASVPSAAASLKASAASLDADLRFEAGPLDGLLRLWLLPSRVAAGSAAVLAGMALVLACLGLYGVLSFSVSQRMREIGVRMALGADARRVVLLVVRDGWRLVARGLAAGAACSLIAAPLLGRLLFDVSAFDPLTLVGVPLLLAVVALAACYVPARRASRLEPLTILRVD